MCLKPYSQRFPNDFTISVLKIQMWWIQNLPYFSVYLRCAWYVELKRTDFFFFWWIQDHVRFPGGKEKKIVNWINLKLSKPFNETMPELEKQVLRFFFFKFPYLKVVLSNYHSDVFMLWLWALVYCGMMRLSTWMRSFLLLEESLMVASWEPKLRILTQTNSHHDTWELWLQQGPKWDCWHLKGSQACLTPHWNQLAPGSPPIWISGMLSMLRGRGLVQKD